MAAIISDIIYFGKMAAIILDYIYLAGVVKVQGKTYGGGGAKILFIWEI